MRKRYQTYVVFFIFALFTSTAHAVALSPVNHGGTSTSGSRPLYYFPVKAASGVCAGYTTTYPSTLLALDPTSTDTASANPTPGILYFDIAATKSLSTIAENGGGSVNSGDVAIYAEDLATNESIALIPDSGFSYVSSDQYRVDYGTTELATRRFGISLPDLASGAKQGLCTVMQDNYSGGSGCETTIGNLPPTINIKIGLIQGSSTAFNTEADTTEISVILANCPPGSTGSAISQPSLNVQVIPGDEEIKIINKSTAPTDGNLISVTNFVSFVDSRTSYPTSNAEKIQGAPTIAESSYKVTGLGNDIEYCTSHAFVNIAGFMSAIPNPSSGESTLCATPSPINGFLSDRACFVATAAYGSEFARHIDTLQAFRDQILYSSKLGSDIVRWYYSWSPGAAKWLLEHPKLRPIVRVALYPLVFFSKVALWLHNFTWLDKAEAAQAEYQQPYIDKLRAKHHLSAPKKPIQKMDAAPSDDVSSALNSDTTNHKTQESYSEPYIESLRQQHGLGEQGDSNYIETVKAGKKLKPKVIGEAKNAAGFSLVAQDRFNIKSDSVQANSFNAVYQPEEKYAPGVDFFYERQFVRHKQFGTLSLGGHLGFITIGGRGFFRNGTTFSDDVKFRFYALPVSIGPSYRLTLAKIVVPFAELGGMAVPFLEIRDDGKGSRRGFSTGVSATIGAALWLDWITRDNAWDQYHNYNVYHSYLIIRYEMLKGVTGKAKFNYRGLYAGLMFEY